LVSNSLQSFNKGGFPLFLKVKISSLKLITVAERLFIAVLELLDPQLKKCQALILAPSADLTQQIRSLIMFLGEHLKIRVSSCNKGSPEEETISSLEDGFQIVMGTTRKY
jgi:hypothetical protein